MYNLEEFKKWLEQRPQIKTTVANETGTEWNVVFNYFADGKESFEAIAQGTPKSSWSPKFMTTFKDYCKWERERESKTKEKTICLI